MIVLLMFLATAGLIATRLIPSMEVAFTRSSEEGLRNHLAEIRQAFDLREKIDPGYSPDLSTPAKIAQALNALQSENLLRSGSLADPWVSPQRWNTSTDSYWIGASNIPFNTSFESTVPPDVANSEIVASWHFGTFDTIAATDSLFFPSQNSGEFDDYPGQNKLGTPFHFTGQSLRIVK